MDQLEQEKKIYAMIGHHPLISHVHSITEAGICLEYYPFGSLRDYFRSLTALPDLEDRLRWCRQAISAFKFIHSKDIVHGDISARNILLPQAKDLKIFDFGFSQIQGERWRGSGETRYCRFRPFTEDEACIMDDIFAIGCLLYEILSGKRPYDDLESIDVEERYKMWNFPTISDLDLHGHGMVIRKCWTELYRSVCGLEEDLPL